MKRVYRMVLLLLFFGFQQSCKTDQKGEETQQVVPIATLTKEDASNANLNISVLLDLSDRINPDKYPSPAMEFYLRDIGYLESVAQSFEWHLLNKREVQIDDKIQVFIDPEPSDLTLNKKISNLKTHFTRANVHKDSILSISDKYGGISRTIYEAAIADNHYVGSDIWGFFKNKVNDYCIDEGYRNILIVLTDGYIYHKDTKMDQGNRTSYLIPQLIKSMGLNTADWQKQVEEKDFGFIVANSDLSDLEVLVLGINPIKGNPYEQDIIRAYWNNWFQAMKVKSFEIKQADLPTHMDKIIQDFILN